MDASALDPIAPGTLAQAVMACSFAIACLCALLARRSIIALLMAFATFEAIVEWRFVLHEWAEPYFEQAFPGWDHFQIQTLLLSLCLIIAVGLMLPVARAFKRADSWQRISYLGLVMMTVMAGIELISRDDMARIIYTFIGPLMVFVWWMAIGGLLVTIGCLGRWVDRKCR